MSEIDADTFFICGVSIWDHSLTSLLIAHEPPAATYSRAEEKNMGPSRRLNRRQLPDSVLMFIFVLPKQFRRMACYALPIDEAVVGIAEQHNVRGVCLQLL
ncbi:MAG: hypothetical protein ACC700_15270 [Anaerolineales bacterium]